MTSQGTSSEGPLKVLTSVTYRESPGESQGTNTKVDNFMKKLFSEVIALVLHVCFCFLQDKRIFKSSKGGRPWEVYGGPSCETSLRHNGTF